MPFPEAPNIKSCCVTWASAVSRAQRVAGGRMTSSNVRRGALDSTARRPVVPKRRENGMAATPPPYRARRLEINPTGSGPPDSVGTHAVDRNSRPSLGRVGTNSPGQSHSSAKPASNCLACARSASWRNRCTPFRPGWIH